MAEHSQNSTQTQHNFEDPAVVAYTNEHQQAEEWEELLKSNEIPAMVRENYSDPSEGRFAVMVPEDYLDEANAIINSQQSYEDFYELINENDELNFFDE